MGIVAVAAFAATAEPSIGDDQHRHLSANQLGREHRQTFLLAFREAILDCNVAPGREARCLQSLQERGAYRRLGLGERPLKYPIIGSHGLLCARAERPTARRRAADQRDELPSPHETDPSGAIGAEC